MGAGLIPSCTFLAHRGPGALLPRPLCAPRPIGLGPGGMQIRVMPQNAGISPAFLGGVRTPSDRTGKARQVEMAGGEAEEKQEIMRGESASSPMEKPCFSLSSTSVSPRPAFYRALDRVGDGPAAKGGGAIAPGGLRPPGPPATAMPRLVLV